MKRKLSQTVFGSSNFLKLWGVQISSVVSANILLFSSINFIFNHTQSTIAVGLLAFLYYLPTVILGFFSGAVVDRFPKDKILIISSLAQALFIWLFLGIKTHPFLIYPLIFLYSSFDEFINPAIGTLLPETVKKEHLGEANSVWFFSSQGAVILGSIGAGLFLKILPSLYAIYPLISLILFAGIIFSLLLFKSSPKLAIVKRQNSQTVDFEEFLQDVKDGYHFIRQEKAVLFPLLLIALTQIITGSAVIALPAISQAAKINFADAPFYLITPALLGAISGSFLVSKIIREKKIRKKTLILRSLLSCGLIVFLISLIITFLPKPIVLVSPLLFLAGFAFVFLLIPAQTLIQENSPLNLRGRVYGALSVLVTIAAAIPVLLTTILIEFLGVKTFLFLAGLAIFLSGIYFQKHQQVIFAQFKNNAQKK